MDTYTKLNRWLDKHITAGRFVILLIVFIITMAFIATTPAIWILANIFPLCALIVIVLQIKNLYNIIKARGPNWQHPRCESCNQSPPLEDDGITPKKYKE
jgi:hypothetical protein